MNDGLTEMWKGYEGKRVFIELTNKRKYTGNVLVVNNDFMVILDKFENRVTIQYKFILTIEEQPTKILTDGKNGNKV